MTMQARAVETRNAILQAAAATFVQRGFAGSSLAEIAALAGVTKGALYFHFPSKAALASAMIQGQADANRSFEAFVDDSDVDRLELLEQMSRELARRVSDDPMLRAAMRLAVEHGDAEDPTIAHTYVAWQRLVERVAAEGMRRGEVAEALPPQQLARFLVGAFTGIQTVSLVASGMGDLAERVDEMWSLLRPALTPR